MIPSRHPRRAFLAGAICLALATPATHAASSGPYRPDWDSLASHPMPEWLLDAKFGIYAHWGVYSVPAFRTEWYPKQMYNPDHEVHAHHVKTWGPLSEFGYKDFIPLFKAERYDPDEWARLIQESGARYAGLAVVHHDGFLLWDSAVSRWNAKRMGPGRDVYGDFVQALRRRGLKTIATEHHIRTFNWYLPGTGRYGEGDLEKIAERLRAANSDLIDPAYADLYWNEITGQYADFMREWRLKLLEVIDNYQPDVLWFDGGNFRGRDSEQTVLEVLAHFHNSAARRGQQVEVLNKLPVSMKYNFPENYGILTYEEGRDREAIVPRPWIDDMKISDIGWAYVEGQKYKSAREILAGLIDRVARGGGLLLNLSPKADGTIPEGQQAALREIGAWLKVNGEAIFGTRPWIVHAEGDEAKLRTVTEHPQWKFQDTDATDIRFTRSKDGRTLYVMALGWPVDGRLRVKSLARGSGHHPGAIARIELLGSSERIAWNQSADGLVITLPAPRAGWTNPALKIVGGN